MSVFPLCSARWSFRDVSTASPWRDAVVPGCVHRDLLRHGLIPDPFWGNNESDVQWVGEHDWEYRTSFDALPDLLDEEQVDLVADGLDTVATVTLNGKVVGTTENMFVRHRWDVKPLLRRSGNVLTVRFSSATSYVNTRRPEHRPRETNDPVGRCTVIRKEQCQFGWDWAPRLITAGIWRDLRLESWSGNRLESVRVVQTHHADGSATLTLTPELAQPERQTLCRWRLQLGDIAVAEGKGTEITVPHPQLWWPNGHGAQPLYWLVVEVDRRDGSSIGSWSRRIGLRTVALERKRDRWGESFRFVVNGRPIFAKGANWIPAHSFVAGLTRADYERDLRAAGSAHLNMLRVWGGGIYESDDFYDLCDELGLLVWQDFMFACTLYPADRAFRASVHTEAGQQVQRLRHRACLALWCGNNEVFSCNAHELKASPKLYANYEKLFHVTLARAVAETDPVTAYWPSSPWRDNADTRHEAGERRGDTHFWDVWHARHPVKDYEKWNFRFVSEFGMQSYNSPATNATFSTEENGNVFGPEMENHQKNRAGNQIIFDYVSRRFRFPDSQPHLIYLSQLNQADCIQTGIEHYRSLMPRCMGALYWQLNDCWPVASWSSIEFTGRWKALHYIVRRAFAPALVTAQIPGDESTTIGNYRRSTVRDVQLYTVYDGRQPTSGRLRWDLFHLDGRIVLRGAKAVALRYGESIRQATLDLAKPLAQYGRDALYLRIALDIGDDCVSEDTVFLTPPRFIALPRAKTEVEVTPTDEDAMVLTFRSAVFQHRFAFHVPDTKYETSDNYFELYPGEPKRVTLQLEAPLTPSRLRKVLVYQSLADTY